MILNVFERINLIHMLPERVGSIDEMIGVSTLRGKLRLDEAEIEFIEYEDTEAGPKWNGPKALESKSEFDITKAERELVVKSFKLLAAQQQLPTADLFVNLYSKFDDN
jgi:hypothetical protein